MGLLDGKVAIITGAGGGLGRAHALAFAKEGCKVVVNDLGGARDGSGGGHGMADDVVAEILDLGGEAVSSYGSVADPGAAQAMVGKALSTWGRLDICVNNAGILRDKTLLKLTVENFDLVLAVHARGTFLVGQAAARAMKELGNGGAIVNTSSIAGLKGNFGQTNYGCAKAGIYGMTLVWAQELMRAGIRVNAIAPVAKTRMTEDIPHVPDEARPEQISPMVVYLASDLAKDVTGRIFGVHGSHFFEYHMQLSPGVQGEGIWSPAEIAEKLEAISSLPSAAGAPAAEADPEDSRVSAQVSEVFAKMPDFFMPERAAGWNALIHFDVQGIGSWTCRIADGVCTTEPGKPPSPTCTVVYDSADTLLGIVVGEINPQQAFMGGKIKADNMGDLMRFATSFDMKRGAERAKAEGGGERGAAVSKPAGMNRAMIGHTYREHAVFVRPEEARAYAAATNDPNPAYAGENPIAPPLLSVRYFHKVVMQSVADPKLGADLLRLLHGEQDMRFFGPLRPMDLVAARATILDIEDKASGQLLKVRQRLMRDGEVVCETLSGYFVRGGGGGNFKSSGGKAPKRPPVAEAGAPIFERSFGVDPDQSLRYAEASLDDNPLHTDEGVARSAGLPGLILHGLCTLAMTAREVVANACGDDPTRLRRLKVRFSRPVFPGDTLTVRAWSLEENEGVRTLGISVTNQDGQAVISNALAEVAA